MPQKIKTSAPGKIHLLGEHAVVYGKPAILTAIKVRCVVELTPRNNTQIEINSQNLDKTITLTIKEIRDKTNKARQTWETYQKTLDISLLKSIHTHVLNHVALAVGETMLYYKKNPKTGFCLSLKSEIPVGAGLGSSAATAAAVASAVSAFFNKPFDKTAINEITFRAEQIAHGLPSGGDNSAVCFGGLIWFRKESLELKIIQQLPFTLPDAIAKNFLIIDTGKPNETTGEIVTRVKSLFGEKPEIVEKFLKSQEDLTRELILAIKNQKEDEMIAIMRKGEKNLESIGVVSSFAQSIIRDIEKVGGAAKICGGGGVTKGVGVILAYHKDVDTLKAVAERHQLPYFQTELGVEGVRIEK